MISLKKHKQQGATLLVGMIMMVVLTLLVVFGIRSSNTNLRIAGNMQSQVEAGAATQQVLEQVIEQIKVLNTVSGIAGLSQQVVPVTVGNAAYDVTVTAMKDMCKFEKNLNESDLISPIPEDDQPCRLSSDMFDLRLTVAELKDPDSTLCKSQQWDIEAGLNDSGGGGVKVSHVQGVTVRVPYTDTKCK